MPGVCGPVSSALRKSVLALRPGVPAGAVEQPAARRERAVLFLPLAHVVDLEQEVGVGRDLLRESSTAAGPTSLPRAPWRRPRRPCR